MGPILPAGMPPGAVYPTDERAPEGLLYFRIYAGVVVVLYGLLTLAGGGMMVAPLFVHPSPGSGGSEVLGFYFAGLVYGAVGLAHLVPTLIALFGGRRPWVHTLSTVVIALGMLNLCCIPVLIPLLIVWMKPETRRWFGAS